LHNKNISTHIKANFIKTANFLEDFVGGIFIIESRFKMRFNQQYLFSGIILFAINRKPIKIKK